MKKFLVLYCILLMLVSSFLSAQEKAVLQTCINEAKPITCTRETIERGIVSLLSPEMNSLVHSAVGEYLFLSYALILDDKGQMIPSQTKVLCNAPVFGDAVFHYFEALPSFVKTDKKEKSIEGRSLYYSSINFIFNVEQKAFEIMEHERLATLGLKPDIGDIGTRPRHRNCKGDDNDTCTRKKITGYFAKKFVAPKLPIGTYRFNISFVIAQDGEIDNIKASDARFEEEAIRVMKKFPDFVPAMVQGLPLRARYNLPVTVSINR